MKLNLTFVKRTERTSSRNGKPFTSLSIKAKEYGDKYLSGFGNSSNKSWDVGQEVEVLKVEEVVKDDKTYYNFEMQKSEPKSAGGISPENFEILRKEHSEILTKLGRLNFTISEIREHLTGQKRLDRLSDGSEFPNFDLPPDAQDVHND